MTKKVFLGGTVDSTWRDYLIPKLNINYFNPIVPDWTPDCMVEEIKQRKSCNYCLYVITPKMTGVYSIAEVIDDSNKCPNKTVFCVLPEDEGQTFDEGQTRSLTQVGKMVENNGGTWLKSLDEVAAFLNKGCTNSENETKLIKDTGNLQLFYHGKEGRQSKYTILMKSTGTPMYQGVGRTQKDLLDYMQQWEKQYTDKNVYTSQGLRTESHR